jgi:hypothetical protein
MLVLHTRIPAHSATPNVLGMPVLLGPVLALPLAEAGRLLPLNSELLLLAAGAVDGLLPLRLSRLL